jgi:hypothetical protein
MRIRNWLLLLARMALVALMALALARPRIASTSTLGDQEVPSALAFVFDTSLSMEYKEKDKTRLREAQDRALEVLRKTHESSQVFVIDSAEPAASAPLSPAAARKRVEGLATRPVNRKLNQAVGQAYRAVAPSDLPRHEVYVLTDLSRSAWDLGPGRTVEGLDAAKKVRDGIATYILRLAPKEPRDIALVEAGPTGGVATRDEPVQVRAKLRSTGPAARRRVELRIDDKPRGQQDVAIPANGEVEVPPFTTQKLDPGLHQGEVRLAGEPDPLEFDDRRHFTINVQPPLRVLVLYDRPIDAVYVINALDPAAIRPGDPRPYHVTRLRSAQLAAQRPDYLKDFAAVYMLNVKALPASEWSRLGRYVHDGGGLVVSLGDLVDRTNYTDQFAANILPAALAESKPKWANTSFGDGDWNSPLFGQYRDEIQKSLSAIPVYRYAPVTPRKDGASRVLLTFLDKAPALIERTFPGPKNGRVLLWTTALSRRADAVPEKDPEAWTEFPYEWSFLVIMDRTVTYLTGTSGQRLTYEAGDDISLPIDTGRRFRNFLIRAPEKKIPDQRLAEPPSNATLVIVSPPAVGPWTVIASGPEGASETLGFSVNYPQGEEQLAQLDARDLDGLFGKDKYKLADDSASLQTAVTERRIGREIFPWVMALILALVTAENFLANRFYREPTGAGAPLAASTRATPAAAAEPEAGRVPA